MTVLRIVVIYRKEFPCHILWLHVGYLIEQVRKSKDIDVDVILIGNTDVDDLSSKLKQTDVAALYFTRDSYDEFNSVVRRLKQSLPTLHITVGYIMPTIYLETFLEYHPDIDSLIIGDNGNTLIDLCHHIEQKIPLILCNGIIYRHENKLVRTPNRKPIVELDGLPFPNRSFIPRISRAHHLLGSRGCNGNCTFCDKNILYGNSNIRYRSVSNIVAEIDHLVCTYQCKYIDFLDSTFMDFKNIVDTYNALFGLYSHLKNKPYWVQFTINLRIEMITPEIMPILLQLREVGLQKVFIGLETGNENDLTLYGKKATLQQNKDISYFIQKCINVVGNYPPLVEFGFINFNPYTSIETLKENLDFFISVAIPINMNMLCSVIRLYHGTSLVSRWMNDNLIKPSKEMLSEFGLKYQFKSIQVETLYLRLIEIYNDVGSWDTHEFSVVYNRYRHFIGKDKISDNAINIFYEYENVTSHFCRCLFSTLLAGMVPEKRDIVEFNNFSNKYITKLRNIINRMNVALYKIDEIIIT